jgi:hypothetical protein
VVQRQPGQIVHEPLYGKKKSSHKKRAGGMAQGIAPEFKPQYHKKKKNWIHPIILDNLSTTDW